MNKSLFNFYLDDKDKRLATEKLDNLIGDTSKGKLAAFLRVQIKVFLNTPDDKINKTLLEAIESEYETTLKMNKRSRN